MRERKCRGIKAPPPPPSPPKTYTKQGKEKERHREKPVFPTSVLQSLPLNSPLAFRQMSGFPGISK